MENEKFLFFFAVFFSSAFIVAHRARDPKTSKTTRNFMRINILFGIFLFLLRVCVSGATTARRQLCVPARGAGRQCDAV